MGYQTSFCVGDFKSVSQQFLRVVIHRNFYICHLSYRFMAAKKKVKIFKEFVNTQFKEIKKPKSDSVSLEEFEEDKIDNNVNNNNSSGDGFSAGKRTAPVLQVENASQSLERVAETAPARRTDANDNSANQNVYSANYSAKYDNSQYETRRQEEPIVRPTVRASGVLDDIRNVNVGLRRIQPTWQGQTPPDQAQGAWNPNLPDERVYRPAEDTLKEQTKQIDKRRRMF